jgi:ubiquinone/menaquinone biosynthesis C-methylase UbiE
VVTGVDVNAHLLQTARRQVPGARFVEGLAEALPFGDEAFDLVFMAHVLHEADDPLEALREAGRAARVRVVVAEWPYRQEEHGPPLHHRLQAHRIRALAGSAGLVGESELTLSHVDVYSFRAK